MAESPSQEFEDDLRLQELVAEQLAVLRAAGWHLPRNNSSENSDGHPVAVTADQ
jgi:hypothetical protein